MLSLTSAFRSDRARHTRHLVCAVVAAFASASIALPVVHAQTATDPVAVEAPVEAPTVTPSVSAQASGETAALAAPELAAPELTAPEAAPEPRVLPGVAERVVQLRASLRQVSRERDEATRLWPLLSLSTGVGVTALGALTGVGFALACKHDCAAPAWISMALVAGAGISVLSTLWLVATDADIRRIESRKYQLEHELDAVELARWQRQRMQAKLPVFWSARFEL